MKLWQKISLLTAAILLISMAVYGGITVYETTNYNLNQTRTTASRQVRTTAYALGQSLSNADTQEMSDTARKAGSLHKRHRMFWKYRKEQRGKYPPSGRKKPSESTGLYRRYTGRL